jgi:hypothetical protein
VVPRLGERLNLDYSLRFKPNLNCSLGATLELVILERSLPRDEDAT